MELIILTTGDRIKALRIKAGLSQDELAGYIGTIKQTVYKYENNIITNIPPEKIMKLSEKLCSSPAYIMGWDDDTNSHKTENSDFTKNPHITEHVRKYSACDERGKHTVDNVLEYEYNRTLRRGAQKIFNTPTAEIKVYLQPSAAGYGNYLSDDSYDVISFPADRVSENADFGVRISGVSMEPDIPDGCIVFVRSCPAIDSGEIGIFNLNGEGYCKKLFIDHGIRIIKLLSLNKEYEPIEIKYEDTLYTFGKVIGIYNN